MNKIKGYRNMAMLKQSDIAHELDITPQAYSNKENGRIPFKPNEMKAIRDLLSKKLNREFTIDELFF